MQAYVRIDEGWLEGSIQQGVLVVTGIEPKTEATARRLVVIPGEKPVKVIVSDRRFRAYDVLMRAGDAKPAWISFGGLSEPSPVRRGCLLWFMSHNHWS